MRTPSQTNYGSLKMKAIILTLVSAATISTAAFAQEVIVNGGTIKFEGEIVNAACAVDTQSANQTVSLGQYTVKSFENGKAGATTPNMPFSIQLNDCDSTVQQNASIGFAGTTISDSVNLLAVNGGGSNITAASGVGIEIVDNQQKAVALDGSYQTTKVLTNGSNKFDFNARYVSTQDIPTPGAANSAVTFMVKYN